MMKNVFDFTLNALFLLEIFQFLLQIFGHVEQCLYNVTSWITIKGNETMKFGQLKEDNIRIFEKLCTKCGDKLVPDPFLLNLY